LARRHPAERMQATVMVYGHHPDLEDQGLPKVVGRLQHTILPEKGQKSSLVSPGGYRYEATTRVQQPDVHVLASASVGRVRRDRPLRERVPSCVDGLEVHAGRASGVPRTPVECGGQRPTKVGATEARQVHRCPAELGKETTSKRNTWSMLGAGDRDRTAMASLEGAVP
jgi:hypothetical protein